MKFSDEGEFSCIRKVDVKRLDRLRARWNAAGQFQGKVEWIIRCKQMDNSKINENLKK